MNFCCAYFWSNAALYRLHRKQGNKFGMRVMWWCGLGDVDRVNEIYTDVSKV